MPKVYVMIVAGDTSRCYVELSSEYIIVEYLLGVSDTIHKYFENSSKYKFACLSQFKNHFTERPNQTKELSHPPPLTKAPLQTYKEIFL